MSNEPSEDLRIVMHAEPGEIRITGEEVRAILGATYTGRSVDIEGEYADAKAWLEAVLDGNADRTWQARFEEAVSEAPLVSGSGTFFRGRILDAPPTEETSFGPPPASSAGCGRYNESGEPVLYLSDTPEGVRREVFPKEEGSLWVRSFTVPCSRIRVADFTALNIVSFEAAVFWLSESQRDRDKESAALEFSRRIAGIVRDQFDGMLVPGVRGSDEVRYSNLVIFHPEPGWRKWVDREASPAELPNFEQPAE